MASTNCSQMKAATRHTTGSACGWLLQPCKRPTCRHACVQATSSMLVGYGNWHDKASQLATSRLRLSTHWDSLNAAQPHREHRNLRLRGIRPAAGPMDGMPTWTLDQIAGLVFGALMLAAVFSAKFLDEWVARQQRKQLGLCEACGGLYEPATCSQAKCPMKNKP